MNFFTISTQTQDFVLRLFSGSGVSSTPADFKYYTCSRCGTFERLHQ